MSSEKAPKGSMLEAEQKSYKIAKIIMSLVSIVLFLISYTALFHTDIHGWVSSAGAFGRTMGIVFYVMSLGSLIFEPVISDKTSSDWLWFVCWFVSVGMALLCPGGFDQL